MALSSKTRQDINDWIKWYNFHADKVGTYPPEGQIAWLLKAVQGTFLCLVQVAREQNEGDLRRAGLELSQGGIALPSARWTK